MANEIIREYAKAAGIPLWRIANAININDGNFSRKLRKELSEQEREKILSVINELKEEK